MDKEGKEDFTQQKQYYVQELLFLSAKNMEEKIQNRQCNCFHLFQ